VKWGDDHPVDLYSYAIHEIGHALFATPHNARFKKWYELGRVTDLDVENYQGEVGKLDEGAHLIDLVDVDSKKGAFGVVSGEMASMPWLVTRYDLLMLKAAGFQLSPYSLWNDLKWNRCGEGVVYRDERVSWHPEFIGGVAPHFISLVRGQIPPGLVLDSYTGKMTGIPTERATFHVVLQVQDSSQVWEPPQYLYCPIEVK
jgi:hypothetical protein